MLSLSQAQVVCDLAHTRVNLHVYEFTLGGDRPTQVQGIQDGQCSPHPRGKQVQLLGCVQTRGVSELGFLASIQEGKGSGV